MELFSEIYSCYFNVISEILNNAPLTKKQIDDLIRKEAFTESSLFLLPKLCNEDGWKLLQKKEDKYYSILNHKSDLPLTLLEKRWLKAILLDPRIQLFMEDETITKFNSKLSDISPLFKQRHFKWFDIFRDGDNFTDENYKINFRYILSAIKEHRILTISYTSSKGKYSTGDYLPIRLQYSQKNDKFRAYVLQIKESKIIGIRTINLARINSIKPTCFLYEKAVDLNKVLNYHICKDPITLIISNERNAAERFMMEFSSYQKVTEYDEVTKNYIASIWYDKKDETELLIQLLAFGPVLTVTGPDKFLNQFKYRVNKQYDMLFE